MLINIQTTDKELKDFFNGFKKDFSLLNQKLDKMSKKDEQILSIVKELDEASNEIASDLQKAIDEIKNGSVSDETIAALQASADKVKALGADPAQPIPPTEPTEPTTPVDKPPVDLPTEPTDNPPVDTPPTDAPADGSEVPA